MKSMIIVPLALAIASSAVAKVYQPVDPYWEPACEVETITEGVIEPGEYFVAPINLTSCTAVGVMYLDWSSSGRTSSRAYMDEERYGARWYPRPDEAKAQAGEFLVKDGHHVFVWQNKSKAPALMSLTASVYPL